MSLSSTVELEPLSPDRRTPKRWRRSNKRTWRGQGPAPSLEPDLRKDEKSGLRAQEISIVKAW
jgi:hypothetical protein